MLAGRPQLVGPRLERQRRQKMACHFWRQRFGAGGVALRDNLVMEISSLGGDQS